MGEGEGVAAEWSVFGWTMCVCGCVLEVECVRELDGLAAGSGRLVYGVKLCEMDCVIIVATTTNSSK